MHTHCLKSLEPNDVQVLFMTLNKEPSVEPSELFLKT